MSEFKWRHFEGGIILWAVRWYCRYGISYRDLEQMMGERGAPVDHSTIYRWVQKYAPEIEKRLRRQWRRPQSTSWRVDETYVKVRGKWAYLYRALDKHGNTIDFYLSPTRNAKAAKRFLGKALNGLKAWEKPEVINTDKAPAYGIAISELKAEGKCPVETVPSPGQVFEQCHRGRSRQAEAADPPSARVQDAEDSLCDDCRV
jgi:IS6 family transposase